MKSLIMEPIAIVGSACRFPGESTTPSKLWQLLQQPHDVRREFDPKRLNLGRFYHPDGEVHGATDVQGRAYLLAEDNRLFDASFFGISPLEAEGMDPQQRLLLETTYEAIEAAGYALDQMRGSRTSVHVGVMTNDYTDIQTRDLETMAQYTSTGTSKSILSNRISYVFDLNGPSVTLDTACSSSLVAIHQAIQAIQSGDCTAALVGGVNLIFDVSMYIMESKLHMLSPDSLSRMWDKSANGYARGEGVAVVFLKPLSQALQDHDHVEGVIRATGVNSDGQSPGITMPRADAQTTLIRETYRRAGLDPIRDRCQYFECHGTGTAAGDPVEAQAVYEALIKDEDKHGLMDDDVGDRDPLYVGSIKTVTGHLEGCAGLAGLFKALLAIQHRIVPPNLLLSELNPKIAPYYGRMQIPQAPIPWPKLRPGEPRRASINSFGFGGTNAHLILESHDHDAPEPRHETPVSHGCQQAHGPFVLSAHSETSLLGNVRAWQEYLESEPPVPLADLTWVLQRRRTEHRTRAYFSGQTREELVAELRQFVDAHPHPVSPGTVGIRHQFINPDEVPGILGVFTGQGAQWPTMGAGLLQKSPIFRRAIEECDASLAALPDGPGWTLLEELTKPASASRIAEAAISQPACTAVQLGLVDVLAASGVRFDAVVGHSSGEIAAVYACGILSRAACMQIAYYRGRYAHLACGPSGQKGAMMAVGISLDEAERFCRDPGSEYLGRLDVAASNAPRTVTLSGDEDAVVQAMQHFDSQGTFARRLRVDTAYHSHHMQRCADQYLEALQACNIEVRQPRPGCWWNSSVRGDAELLQHGDLAALKGPYWVRNMVQPVLFSHALRSALWHGGPFDLAIEIGPHAALRGPTEQTLRAAFGTPPAYTGTLQRGGDDIVALSATTGFIWAHLGSRFVDFEGFRQAIAAPQEDQATRPPNMVKNLPAYVWEHDRVYWRESRLSKKLRVGTDRPHELLGRRTPDDHDGEMRWRNVIKLKELPWVAGHEILDQALLPGASYISLAFQAGQALAGDRPIALLEVQDVDIHRPVTVPSTREGHETLFTLRKRDSQHPEVLLADFSYYYCPDERVGSMVNTCAGRLVVHLATERTAAASAGLPARGEPPAADLLPVDMDEAYGVMHQAGMHYTGIFRRLREGRRRWGYATAGAEWSGSELGSPAGADASHDTNSEYVMHPALLDVAFQTLFLARAHPGAGPLPATLLPVRLRRAVLDPRVALRGQVSIEAFVTHRDGLSLSGDLSVYDAVTEAAAVQVEGLAIKPIAPPTEAQDRALFSDTVFLPDPSLGLLEEPGRAPAGRDLDLEQVDDVERAVVFYMKQLLAQVDEDERQTFAWHHQLMVEFFEHQLKAVGQGSHPIARREWLDDGPDVLARLLAKWPGVIDMVMVQATGESLLDVWRGKTQMLEVLMKDNQLPRLYNEGLGFSVVNEAFGRVVKPIANKFPRANYLEIGAGTGSATHTMFESIGDAWDTYTYTDISTGFFENAQARFASQRSRMVFKTLDIERDPVTQGFTMHSYDVIIASNVLHATADLSRTLHHARSLLRPGGFLFLMEITGIEVLRPSFVMGGLPGWWLGEADGRRFHPGVTADDWHSRLQAAGFTGLDLVFHDSPDPDKHCASFLVSQAANDTVLHLRDPLAPAVADLLPEPEVLLLIGGKRLPVAQIVTQLQRLCPTPWRSRIVHARQLETVDVASLPSSGVDVICLQDLDDPVFAVPVPAPRLRALQALLERAANLLWVTRDRRSGQPYANMFSGMARSLRQEMPHLQVQSLDLESSLSSSSQGQASVAARAVLEACIRLHIFAAHRHDKDNLLWAHEPEVVMQGGVALIPRVKYNHALNDRYNARYRTITAAANVQETPISVSRRAETLSLVAASEGELAAAAASAANPKPGQELVRIRSNYVLCLPSDGAEEAYLTLGSVIEGGSDSAILAVSDRNASLLDLPRAQVLDLQRYADALTDPGALLEAVAEQLLALAICKSVAPGSSVLLQDVPEALGELVASQGARCGHTVTLVSTSANKASPSPTGRTIIHPNSSMRAVQALVPPNVDLLVNGNFDDPQNGNSSSSLWMKLPARVREIRLTSGLLRQALLLQRGTTSTYSSDPLSDAYRRAQALRSQKLPSSDSSAAHWPIPILGAEELPGAGVSLHHQPYIVHWPARGELSAVVQPADASAIFDAQKTYLMVGMAGGLGLALCEWAVRHGAKHLVITSRRPNIDPRWLAMARHNGAQIHVKAMDVSSRSSVESVVKEIQSQGRCSPSDSATAIKLPPLGGVCNAAMVLVDQLFADMDIDGLNETLKPKVDGSRHLDAVLHDTPLDFFIMLSSAAVIIGTAGQSSYHAANSFMSALVAQRRSRGRAASIIHVGAVADVGYVTRQGRGVRDFFNSMHFNFISEEDVQLAFIEAIRTGAPDSPSSCEINLGVEGLDRGVSMTADEVPAWLKDPRLAHLTPYTHVEGSAGAAAAASDRNQQDLRQQIHQVESEEQAVAIVQALFTDKLEAMMQLAAGSVDPHRSLIDVGIDSLVAVEIRTWFFKELGTDIPVLKVLGGGSVVSISITAAKQLLALQMNSSRRAEADKDKAGTTDADTSPTVVPQQMEVQGGQDQPEATCGSEAADDSSSSNSNSGLDHSPPPKSETSISRDGLQDSSDDDTQDSEPVVKKAMPTTLFSERMSVPQARLWALSQHFGDPTAYNLVFQFAVDSQLDVARLRHALTAVMRHHESLRTRFHARVEDHHPMQSVMASPVPWFKHVARATDEDVEAERQALQGKVWDIERGETLGMTVLSLSPRADSSAHRHVLLLGYHHIVMDAMSWRAFLRDLDVAYRLQSIPVPDPRPKTYIDYTRQLLQSLATGRFEEQLQYWQREHQTLPLPLPVLPPAIESARGAATTSAYTLAPAGNNAPSGHSYASTRVPGAVGDAVRAACKMLRITPFHFSLAALQVLLARLGGVEDVCIGVADANRLDDEYADTVGFFMNLLPLRFRVSGNMHFSRLALNTSRHVLAALAHSAVPFDTILDRLDVPRSLLHTPLFQVALNYRLGLVRTVPLGQHNMTLVDFVEAQNPYDLSFGIVELPAGEGFGAELTSSAARYSGAATQALLDLYVGLLEMLAREVNWNMPLSQLPLYPPADVEHALMLGRGPQVQYDWTLLSSRVQDVSRAFPTHTAVRVSSKDMTYAELEKRTASIASALLGALGVNDGVSNGIGSHIAVLCEPSADSVATMLAILRIGSVYVPLDVSMPPARHRAMVEECRPVLVVHQTTTAEGVVAAGLDQLLPTSRVLHLDEIDDGGSLQEGYRPPPASPPAPSDEAPAILLFTSGSTGRPKGVLLSQHNFANHVALKSDRLRLQAGSEAVLQQSALGFDMALIQTFTALCTGGTVVIVPQEARRDPAEIARLMRQSHVSLTIATPSEYTIWLRYGSEDLRHCAEWRHACLGGEPVRQTLVQGLRQVNRKQQLALLNCYGPTEITAAATFHPIPLEEDERREEEWLGPGNVVGKVIPNYSVCILDSAGQPMPVGFRGEIAIGGAGVAAGGYLQPQPQQKQQKFVVATELHNSLGLGKLYRTGDQGRLTADGTLVLLGRLDGDSQVKLRGNRIELEEVERAILTAAGGRLSNAVVSVRDELLVAHVVMADGQSAGQDHHDLLSSLLPKLGLPQYMHPAQLNVLDHLPLTANGKVDRQAVANLPLSLAQAQAQAYGPSSGAAKMTLREGELRLLWEKVLLQSSQPRRLTSESDFFLAGGNSLQLIKLQQAIRESMNVQLPIAALYRACTLREMANLVDDARLHGQPAEEIHIDWNRETAIPASLLAGLRGTPRPFTSVPRKKRESGGVELLLTGATGFLGREIAQSLLRDPAVDHIHCVGILPDDIPTSSLPASDRLTIYPGSLSAPDLGLTPASIQFLSRQVDAIVHAGADGHCLNQYSSVRAANVESTKFLASLAARRCPNAQPIPLLYVSSPRVPLLLEESTATSASTSTSTSTSCAYGPTALITPPPADGSEGYTASKWASEQFLAKLGRQAPQWPIQVHRPCLLLGEQAPTSDALNALLRFSLRIGAVAELLPGQFQGYFDFAAVEDVAGCIASAAVGLAIAGTGPGGVGEKGTTNAIRTTTAVMEDTAVRFCHHSSGIKISLAELPSHLQSLHGLEAPLARLSFADWMARARDAGLDPLIATYLEAIVEGGRVLRFPFLGEGKEWIIR